MTVQKKALLLVGSPRTRSTSEVLGIYLLDKLFESGIEIEELRIYRLMKSHEGQKQLLSSIDRSDILILSFPLYIDSLPSLVTKALEMIWEHRSSLENPKKHQFVAISNNGFPEAHQNDTALEICRHFAMETGMEWAGSLGVGGGEGIKFMLDLFKAKQLEKVSFVSRNDIKSLDSIAEFLSTGGSIPQEVMELRTTRQMPKWLYTLVGTLFVWKRNAKKNKVWDRIYDHPYQS